ncbi:MAG: hypothetical protein JST67_04515 [Bacteroidetes bacterium]|nr:hypothetical protein [Bacteroidota bacterium]
MNTVLKTTLSLVIAASIVSCGTKKEKKEQDLTAPQGMYYFDMSKTGMNIYALIPDSTVGVLDTAMQSSGEYLIKVGKDFQVSVIESNGDIKQRKADIEADDVNKLKKYFTNDSTTLMWQSGIADMSEFHFYQIMHVGNRTYVFEDIKGEPFSEQATQKMLDACKKAQEKITTGKES